MRWAAGRPGYPGVPRMRGCRGGDGSAVAVLWPPPLRARPRGPGPSAAWWRALARNGPSHGRRRGATSQAEHPVLRKTGVLTEGPGCRSGAAPGYAAGDARLGRCAGATSITRWPAQSWPRRRRSARRRCPGIRELVGKGVRASSMAYRVGLCGLARYQASTFDSGARHIPHRTRGAVPGSDGPCGKSRRRIHISPTAFARSRCGQSRCSRE